MSEVTDAQIVAFFRDVAPLSRTGVLVYNAPGIGITLSPGVLEQLADIPGVVGAKQGDLSPTAIDQIANRIGGRIRLFCASDLAFLGPMMCGFDGISSTSQLARCRSLFSARIGHWRREMPRPRAIFIGSGIHSARWRASSASRRPPRRQ